MMTLSEAIDEYIKLKSNVLSPSTIRGYSQIKRNNLQPEMDMPIRKITGVVAQQAINREAGKYSPKTVRNIYGLLTAVMKQYLGHSPMARLPQDIPSEVIALSEAQLIDLLRVIQGECIELPILLALFLGLRRSEIAALKHEDYDADTKILKINKALVPTKDNIFVEKTTKTVKSNRRLSVPPYLAAKIEAQISKGDPLCPVSPSYICTRLGKLCAANGLPHIRLHDLRHQNASVMLALGVADKYAMERGGWSSNATMKNIYQHTMPDERIEVDKRINSYFENLAAKSTRKRVTCRVTRVTAKR